MPTAGMFKSAVSPGGDTIKKRSKASTGGVSTGKGAVTKPLSARSYPRKPSETPSPKFREPETKDEDDEHPSLALSQRLANAFIVGARAGGPQSTTAGAIMQGALSGAAMGIQLTGALRQYQADVEKWGETRKNKKKGSTEATLSMQAVT